MPRCPPGSTLFPYTTLFRSGSIVAAYLYWDWFMQPVLNLGNFYNQMMMAMAGAERIFNLLDTPPDVRDLPGAKPIPRIVRSEEHTSELQSQSKLVCRRLLEK